MNFNLVSKNNLGVVGALMLAILLSQSRMFNFLVDTVLGRFALIAMLIFISYTNKILGVVSVLLIVVLFNVSDIGYLEGFEDNGDNGDKKEEKKDEVPKDEKKSDEPSSTQENNDENDKDVKKIVLTAAATQAAQPENEPINETTTATETVATEGFNILGMENEIRQGKNSNTIPVSSLMSSSDSALPYDPSTITENFSAY
jgi:hypothetical protein